MAKKKVISEMTIISEVYPEVSYTLIPLTNRLQLHVGAINVFTLGDEKVSDHGQVGYDTIGFGLLAIDGIDDYELEFEKRKIGKKRTEKKVIDRCIDELPTDLLGEIFGHLNASSGMSKEEKENLDFTSPSSQATTSSPAKSVMETTEDVSSKPEAERVCSVETK